MLICLFSLQKIAGVLVFWGLLVILDTQGNIGVFLHGCFAKDGASRRWSLLLLRARRKPRFFLSFLSPSALAVFCPLWDVLDPLRGTCSALFKAG